VCGEATRAEVPAGVPAGGFGPRVQAITALCTGAYHLSKRTTQTVLADLFGVSMGLGTVANLEQATAQVLAEPVAEARAYVQAQPTAYLDETGWRERRQRAWLWAAVTAGVTVFVIRLSRSGKVAQELLGDRFWGYLVTDRWSAYTWYPPWRRQVCWGSFAGAGPPDVPLVAPGPRWDVGPCQLCFLYAADPAGGGAAAGSGPDL
jgi:transposase